MVRGSSFWISPPFETVSSEGLTIHSPICSAPSVSPLGICRASRG